MFWFTDVGLTNVCGCVLAQRLWVGVGGCVVSKHLELPSEVWAVNVVQFLEIRIWCVTVDSPRQMKLTVNKETKFPIQGKKKNSSNTMRVVHKFVAFEQILFGIL